MSAPRGNSKTAKKTTRRRSSREVIEHSRASDVEFTNREIGWLHFNRRVLHEAEDSRTPLLERLRFLAISDSNLDEFFMKRVGGLKRQVAAGISPKSSDGKTPQEQLTLIRSYVQDMMKAQASCYKQLLQELAKQEIHLLRWKDLSAGEREFVRVYYKKNIFPVLTPLSVDPGHPFPFISNLSVSLGVTLKHPDQEDKHFARIKMPKNKDTMPPWIRVDGDPKSSRFISLIEVVRENLGDLFPSMQVLDVMPFRVTRNVELDRDDDEAEDLLKMIAEELRQRRFAEVVRIEHGPNPDPWMLKFLMDELELGEDDIYSHPGELDYSDLLVVADLDRPELRDPPHQPVVPLAFRDEGQSVFSLLRVGDHLVHHPYESFSATVERFIREAALDPKVLAIKMTLYRTGDNSPFVRSLIRAAEAGKQVVCLVELKARFDEERNIYWAQALEKAGVHVVYGIVGLKTHAKMALVVRQEADGIRCYAHAGTGNYNVQTSRFYTDLGLLTSREEITGEIVEFFHYLTGRSLKKDYQNLLIAPVNMFRRFKEMVEREAAHAKAGRPAQIIAKCNNMEENDIALSLYEASRAGVGIDLIVRGFACVRPGVPGLSERLRVISVIGRFLEHSRIFYFRNGAADPLDGEFFIGSADWMYRNLHARVESVVPIWDRALREKLWEILQLTLKDQRQTWDMHADGGYTQRKSAETGLHNQLIQLTKTRNTPSEESGGENGPAENDGTVPDQTRGRGGS
ncbi:MAG: polyphosphate kinase 1 [Bdellovibrionaceae bacterium]|nr:polyphosphate kinase 1 [Pseudobdellovibrionaceae bacterium]MBX3034477.1 polyphosphate kinase 1 [Pseudobdellovibrionaceae bacterium]